MNHLAIRVDGLSKRYRIGDRTPHKTIREALTGLNPIPRIFSTKTRSLNHHIWALKGVSFEVEKGEIVGVIGRNGSGKSTLLKILSRITEPTEGRAEIYGRTGSLLEVGTGFHQELTGRENIHLCGTILGMKKSDIDRKFDEIVTFADVEKFIDTPVKYYSSGMHVRLAFAVAAHFEPEILLIDEVLAVGDLIFQKKCLQKMRSVASEGRTVLLVSHNMSAVSSLCRRAILLDKGRVVTDDSVDKAVAQYVASGRVPETLSREGVSLVQHRGRLKQLGGPVFLTHCRLTDRERQSSTVFRSGDEVRIVVGYRNNLSVRKWGLVFFASVNDMTQYRLFACSNALVGSEFEDLASQGEVECVIPRLPLAPGAYTVTLGCKVGPAWSDQVYEAVELQVLPGDFYGTQRVTPDGWGSSLVDHYWLKIGENDKAQ